MKSNRKTINPQRENRRATFDNNRKSTRQFTYYLLTLTHNVNKHGRHRRSAINIRQLSAIKNTTPHDQRLQINAEKEQQRGQTGGRTSIPSHVQRSNRLTSDTDVRCRQQPQRTTATHAQHATTLALIDGPRTGDTHSALSTSVRTATSDK